jgi:hypothetical protein
VDPYYASQQKNDYDRLSKYYGGILQGGEALQRSVAPAIDATNQTYAGAKQAVLNNAYTRGGALDKGMRNLQSSKAYSLSNLYGQAQGQAAQGLASLTGQGMANNASVVANAAYQDYLRGQQNKEALMGAGSLLARLLSGFSNQSSATQGVDFSGANKAAPLPSPVMKPTPTSVNVGGYTNPSSQNWNYAPNSSGPSYRGIPNQNPYDFRGYNG